MSRSLIPSRLFFCLLSAAVVVPVVYSTLTVASARGAEGDEDSLYKHLAVFTEVLGLVNQAYVEPAEEELLLAGALDGATDALDPFSLYVPQDGVATYEATRQVGYRHSGLFLLRDRGVIFVVGVIDGSPAAEAGLQVADVISEIEGENTRLMPLWQIQNRLAAAPGEQISLHVLRGQQVLDLDVRLARFPVPPVESRDEDGIAVVRIHHFEPETPSQLEALLTDSLAGRDKLVFDLRGVAGGDLAAAYQSARLFADGPLGSLKGRGGELESYSGAEPRWNGRLVVLVNRGTVQAAEIFATVLRQKVDAELVGERTFGYAGRLGTVDLSSGGRLWLTEAFYTGPDGEPHSAALEPDVLVSGARRAVVQGDEEAEDRVLLRGLEVLRQDPADEASREEAA